MDHSWPTLLFITKYQRMLSIWLAAMKKFHFFWSHFFLVYRVEQLKRWCKYLSFCCDNAIPTCLNWRIDITQNEKSTLNYTLMNGEVLLMSGNKSHVRACVDPTLIPSSCMPPSTYTPIYNSMRACMNERSLEEVGTCCNIGSSHTTILRFQAKRALSVPVLQLRNWRSRLQPYPRK